MVSFEDRKALFKPGTVIELGGTHQLSDFENMILPIVHPRINKNHLRRWRELPILKELVRPPDYNGTIADIELQIMGEPYKELLAAREAGWSFGSTSPRLSAEHEAAGLPHVMGFSFLARAKSSSPSNKGIIENRLWYCPAWSFENGKLKISSSWPQGVRRIVPAPNYTKHETANFPSDAQRIGFAALRSAMLELVHSEVESNVS